MTLDLAQAFASKFGSTRCKHLTGLPTSIRCTEREDDGQTVVGWRGTHTHTEQKVWATWTRGRETQQDSFTRYFDSERSWKLKIFSSSEQPQQLTADRLNSLCMSHARVQSNGKQKSMSADKSAVSTATHQGKQGQFLSKFWSLAPPGLSRP